MSSLTSTSFSDTLPPGSEEHFLQFEEGMFISTDKWQQRVTTILNQSSLLRHAIQRCTTDDVLNIAMLQQSSILSLKPEPLGPIKAARFKVIVNESREEKSCRLEIWKVNQGLILQQRNEKASKHTKDMERFDLLPTHSIISCRLIMAFMSPQSRNVLLAVYPMISHYLQKSEVFQLYGEVLSAINSYSPSIQLHAFRSINN